MGSNVHLLPDNIVATKQRFISQVRQGSSGQRSFEDKDETLLSFEAVQAIASGNPLIMDKINLDNRISQLQLLLAEYNNQRYRLQDQIEIQIPAQRAKLEQLAQKLGSDAATVSVFASKDFIMHVDGKGYDNRAEAGDALIQLSRTVEPDGFLTVGEYKDLSVDLVHETKSNTIQIRLKGDGIYLAELNETSGIGTIARIDNLIKDIPVRHERAVSELEQLEKSLSSAIEELARPFEFTDELEQGIARQAELNAQLSIEDKSEENITEETNYNVEYKSEAVL